MIIYGYTVNGAKVHEKAYEYYHIEIAAVHRLPFTVHRLPCTVYRAPKLLFVRKTFQVSKTWKV
jgi:hypothetical protein